MIKLGTSLPDIEEFETSEHASPASETPVAIKVIHLEDGRRAPIEAGGMVDLALHEFGAKVVEVKIIDAQEVPVVIVNN